MADFKGKDFSGKNVVIDGNRYEECKLNNATLVYNGGGAPSLIRCDISNATVTFGEAAERTAIFMVAMAKDPALSGFVRQLFPDLVR